MAWQGRTVTMQGLDGKVVVYFVYAPGGRAVKIGYTSNLLARVDSIATGCPFDVLPVAVIFGGADVEHAVHEALSQYRMRGEWFDDVPEVWRYVEDNAYLLTEEVGPEPISDRARVYWAMPTADVDDSPYRTLNSKNIREAFDAARLNPVHRKVLSMLFGLEDGVIRDRKGVGKLLGVTRERVRQVAEDGLGELRRSGAFDGFELPKDVLFFHG